MERHRERTSTDFVKPTSSKFAQWVTHPLFLALCAVDIAIQAVAVGFADWFRGIGILALPLAPLLLAWFASVLLAALGGMGLVVACALRRSTWPVGAVVAILSAINLSRAASFMESVQSTPKEIQANARCQGQVAELHRKLAIWFAAPRRVVAVVDRNLSFETGPSIDVCTWGDRRCGGDPPSVARREAFARFVAAHVVGQEVQVSFPASQLHRSGLGWCAVDSGPVPAIVDDGMSDVYVGEVHFRGKRLTVTEPPPDISNFR